jgi:hypothetical protein
MHRVARATMQFTPTAGASVSGTQRGLEILGCGSHSANLSDGAILVFFDPQGLPGEYINHIGTFQSTGGAWCVRGGSGSQIQ